MIENLDVGSLDSEMLDHVDVWTKEGKPLEFGVEKLSRHCVVRLPNIQEGDELASR